MSQAGGTRNLHQSVQNKPRSHHEWLLQLLIRRRFVCQKSNTVSPVYVWDSSLPVFFITAASGARKPWRWPWDTAKPMSIASYYAVGPRGSYFSIPRPDPFKHANRCLRMPQYIRRDVGPERSVFFRKRATDMRRRRAVIISEGLDFAARVRSGCEIRRLPSNYIPWKSSLRGPCLEGCHTSPPHLRVPNFPMTLYQWWCGVPCGATDLHLLE